MWLPPMRFKPTPPAVREIVSTLGAIGAVMSVSTQHEGTLHTHLWSWG